MEILSFFVVPTIRFVTYFYHLRHFSVVEVYFSLSFSLDSF